MKICLFDTRTTRQNLLPLTFTRPVAEIRVGILTIAEKWAKYLDADVYYCTEDYLQTKFRLPEPGHSYLYINGAVCPGSMLVNDIKQLAPGEVLMNNDVVIAFLAGHVENPEMAAVELERIEFLGEPLMIESLTDIFTKNGKALEKDFALLTQGRESAPLPEYVTAVNPKNIFIEPTAKLSPCMLNASSGPIYIGSNAEVMDGSIVRGPFALCDNGVLKMAAKIYGPTTIGPGCKVGGEVNNSVFFANSSKAHDGFIGNAVIGEWCNLGADTNNSNLKNNYANVKLWSYTTKRFEDTGLQFCGLVMADHSKCGINTMFNTGTVVGVSCNIFGAGFPRNFIADFSWGGAQGVTTYSLDKVYETAARVFERRGLLFSATEQDILKTVFELTKEFRG